MSTLQDKETVSISECETEETTREEAFVTLSTLRVSFLAFSVCMRASSSSLSCASGLLDGCF